MTKSKYTKQKNIYNSKRPVDEFKCDKNLSFDDCELAILKHNVDIIENPEIVSVSKDFVNQKSNYYETFFLNMFKECMKFEDPKKIDLFSNVT